MSISEQVKSSSTGESLPRTWAGLPVRTRAKINGFFASAIFLMMPILWCLNELSLELGYLPVFQNSDLDFSFQGFFSSVQVSRYFTGPVYTVTLLLVGVVVLLLANTLYLYVRFVRMNKVEIVNGIQVLWNSVKQSFLDFRSCWARLLQDDSLRPEDDLLARKWGKDANVLVGVSAAFGLGFVLLAVWGVAHDQKIYSSWNHPIFSMMAVMILACGVLGVWAFIKRAQHAWAWRAFIREAAASFLRWMKVFYWENEDIKKMRSIRVTFSWQRILIFMILLASTVWGSFVASEWVAEQTLVLLLRHHQSSYYFYEGEHPWSLDVLSAKPYERSKRFNVSPKRERLELNWFERKALADYYKNNVRTAEQLGWGPSEMALWSDVLWKKFDQYSGKSLTPLDDLLPIIQPFKGKGIDFTLLGPRAVRFEFKNSSASTDLYLNDREGSGMAFENQVLWLVNNGEFQQSIKMIDFKAGLVLFASRRNRSDIYTQRGATNLAHGLNFWLGSFTLGWALVLSLSCFLKMSYNPAKNSSP